MINTTGDLKNVIREAFPNSAKFETNKVIKKTF